MKSRNVPPALLPGILFALAASLAWRPACGESLDDLEAEKGWIVSTQVSARDWSLESDDLRREVSQWVVTSWASLATGSWWELEATTSRARGNLSEPAGQAQLEGWTNLLLQASAFLLGDQLLLQAGVGLPTGTTGLDSLELRTARWLWNPLLGFPVRRYGEGWVLHGAVTWLQELSVGDLGLALSGTWRGPYDLASRGPEYQPGASASLHAVLEGEKRRLEVRGQVFDWDSYGRAAFFREGAQLELRAASETRLGRFDISASVLGAWKEDNRIRRRTAEGLEEIHQAAGRTLFGEAEVLHPFGRRLWVGAQVEGTLFEGFQDASETGWSLGVGPSLRWRPHPGWSVVAGFEFFQGRMDKGNVRIEGHRTLLGMLWQP
jgi:hypothetical protein